MLRETVSPPHAAGQCLRKVDVLAYLRGEILAPRQREIHEHCEACPRCDRFFAAVREAKAL